MLPISRGEPHHSIYFLEILILFVCNLSCIQDEPGQPRLPTPDCRSRWWHIRRSEHIQMQVSFDNFYLMKSCVIVKIMMLYLLADDNVMGGSCIVLLVTYLVSARAS